MYIVSLRILEMAGNADVYFLWALNYIIYIMFEYDKSFFWIMEYERNHNRNARAFRNERIRFIINKEME